MYEVKDAPWIGLCEEDYEELCGYYDEDDHSAEEGEWE